MKNTKITLEKKNKKIIIIHQGNIKGNIKSLRKGGYNLKDKAKQIISINCLMLEMLFI